MSVNKKCRATYAEDRLVELGATWYSDGIPLRSWDKAQTRGGPEDKSDGIQVLRRSWPWGSNRWRLSNLLDLRTAWSQFRGEVGPLNLNQTGKGKIGRRRRPLFHMGRARKGGTKKNYTRGPSSPLGLSDLKVGLNL